MKSTQKGEPTIRKVDSKKIKKYYEDKLNSGKPLSKSQSDKYYKDSKTHKARIINKYNVLIGNMCSGEVLRGLIAGGYRWRSQLSKPKNWTKKQKVKGIIAIQFSVQVLQARLDASVLEDNRLGEERDCVGTADVSSSEKKKAGSTLENISKSNKDAKSKVEEKEKSKNITD